MKNGLCQILSCIYQNKSNFGKHWLHSLAVKIEMKMGYGVFTHSVVYLTAQKSPDGLAEGKSAMTRNLASDQVGGTIAESGG